MIRQFEEISMNAWPALQTLVYDGWIIRFGNGVTRRANSIVPIYDSTLNIESKIGFCEDLYNEQNLPVIFKMTSSVNPYDLDSILDKKGYVFDAETSLQTLKLSNHKVGNECNILTNNEVNDNWLLNYMKFNNHDENKFDTFKKILNQIKINKCLLEVLNDNHVVGCGLGVLEGKFIGLFDIVVDHNYRYKGYGRIIVESLLDWGKTQGAETAYLQVMLNNLPALRLYEKLGFREEYKYWYRIKKRHYTSPNNHS